MTNVGGGATEGSTQCYIWLTCILVKQVATDMTGSKEICRFYKGVIFFQAEPSFWACLACFSLNVPLTPSPSGSNYSSICVSVSMKEEMSHKLTHNVPTSSQFHPPCHAGRCCLPNPSASHPFLTLFPVIPFLSRPFPIFLSSLSHPASHHLFITLRHSLGRVTVPIRVQDWIFLGRGSILGAVLQRIIHVQILCDTQ